MGLQPPLPHNELARLAALRQYQILDTPSEKVFDDFTFLAAQICRTPIALISFVDGDRQWFKSKVGVDVDCTPRDVAFCAYAIMQQQPLVVPNALKDSRFADNPLVAQEPKIRFYAGAPLITPEGFGIGTLCVVDTVARDLSLEQQEGLRALSNQVIAQLEMRRNVLTVSRNIIKRQQKDAEIRQKQEFIEVIYRRGLDKLQKGNYQAAIVDFSQYLQIKPNGIKAYHQRGLAFHKLGDYQNAIADLNQYLRFNPADAEARYSRGLIRSQLGDYNGATADYTQGLSINPEYINNYSQVDNHNSELILPESEDYYQKITLDSIEATSIQPDYTVTVDSNIISSELNNEYHRAISESAENLPPLSENVEVYIKLANDCYKNQNYTKALENYTLALQLNSNNALIYLNRGHANYKLKNYGDAIEDYTQTLRLNPDNDKAYIGLGNTCCEMKNYEKAIEYYTQALILKPDNDKAYISRGNARSKLKDYTGAMEDYKMVWARKG
ncbi:MAG: tetratricopeptide repeat protein [Richelia sp. RM2_1_2]|nr:tetratricopeptide repeat protein [Richelia sp. SM1_7_0]NJN08553.1 tetratricopeptide repeat protein [Richelia sp. RM1_1_1]NJO27570.1 tetratricopeptide repeat protein [Richelia sp. SL_2_1]NJO57296.1 tetratricopeptide repeat protein [Richelia sp. RM2_1_2]